VHGKRVTTFTQINPSSDSLNLPRSFFANLANYGANIMSQTKALRTLKQRRISHVAQGSADPPLNDISADKSLMVHVRSSDILASGNNTKQPWAQEFITLAWKGLAPLSATETKLLWASVNSSQQQAPKLRVMVEAKVAVTDRAKFATLQHKLDRDVLYDRRLGQFTLRFQQEVDSGLIAELEARMQAIDRLVGIVDALRRGGKHVAAERITLQELVFNYDSALAPVSSAQERRPWTARLDLTNEKNVKVILEAKNPHLRVIDYLQAAANSPTFGKIPAWLIFTLPLFRALERMQDAWDAALGKASGACYIFHKTLDWVTIRFALAGATNRRVHLDIKPRDKAGDLMWHVYRPSTDANANNENDEFNKLLKQHVWTSSGKGFKGLVNSAAASWDTGIETLIALISDTILTLVGTPAPPPQPQQPQQLPQRPQPPSQDQPQQPTTAPAQGPNPNPQARMPHQLQQQQQQSYKQHLQQQQQQQQLRLPPQHQQHNMQPQPNMQHQGQVQQGQGQQRPGNFNKNNAPVVVLD
jgi:mediator of RNA polymerase II transcription subunit 14